MEDAALDRWFVEEVLPCERVLMAVLRRHAGSDAQLADLRQEVYARVFDAARRSTPECTRAFVLQVARHLLIDQARRARVVAIDFLEELGTLEPAAADASPEQWLSGRQQLRLLQQGLQRLAPRCREAFELRRIEGLPTAEVAARMGVQPDTVERQTAAALRMLTEWMGGRAVRVPAASRAAAHEGHA